MSGPFGAPALVLAIGITAAIVLGFSGAAAMATGAGRTFSATLGVLILVSGVIEGARMIAGSRRALRA
jgi:hypothetical protein